MFNLLIRNEGDYRNYCKRTKGEAERKQLLLLLLVQEDEKETIRPIFSAGTGRQEENSPAGLCPLN